MRRRLLRGGAISLGVLVAFAALIGIEVVLAGRGPTLTEYDPKLADGIVGRDPQDPRAPLRIVWIGDSTAAGVGSSGPAGAASHQIAERLHRPVDLTILAVSGNRVADVVANQVGAVPADADLVIISVGANDVTHLTSADEFRRDYQAMLDRLPRTATVIALGVPDIGSPTRLAQPLRFIAGKRGEMYDGIVRELAPAAGATYVFLARETGPSFRADPDRLLAADHYHPSDAGYGVWADKITPVVAWAIDVREHPDRPRPPVPEEAR